MLGRHTAVAAAAEALIAQYPLRESLWRIRALALARCGRQADALGVIEDLRKVLDEELGLLPGPAIRELQSAILQQDSSIDWERPVSAVPMHRPRRPPSPTRTGPTGCRYRARTPVAHRRPGGRAGRTVGGVAAICVGIDEFVVISGEAGIGKTRLVAETVATAARDGALVGWAAARRTTVRRRCGRGRRS